MSHNKLLITGGGSGLGWALAQKFRSLQNELVLTGRNKGQLQKASEKLQCDYIVADLTNPHDLQNLFSEIYQIHPDLNIVINNAGIQHQYSFLEKGEKQQSIQQEIATNLISPMQLVSALLPLLLEQVNAAIVNISSGLALTPKRSAAVYSASKAGLHSFSVALRHQLKDTHISVFEMLPPLVDTPMTAGRAGRKISPEDAVNEFVTDFRHNRYESYIGPVKFLKTIHRISPWIANHLLNLRG